MESKLKINFLGDSITEGAGSTEHIYCYVKQVEALLGAECRNYGISGTRIARQKKPSADPRHDLDFCSRIEQMDANADVVAIFGGTNDYGHGDALMGTIDDRTPDTFYGALHYLYENTVRKYPDALVFVMTPLHRAVEDNPRGEGSKDQDGPILRDYVRAIRDVAEWYSLPVLDLFANSGICPSIPAHREKYTGDGLHPNNLGHRIVAERVADFIASRLKLK